MYFHRKYLSICIWKPKCNNNSLNWYSFDHKFHLIGNNVKSLLTRHPSLNSERLENIRQIPCYCSNSANWDSQLSERVLYTMSWWLSVFFYKQYVRFLQTVAPDGLLFVRFLEYVRFFTVCQISYVRFSGFGGKIRRIFQ